jgi:hypothetical protein
LQEHNLLPVQRFLLTMPVRALAVTVGMALNRQPFIANSCLAVNLIRGQDAPGPTIRQPRRSDYRPGVLERVGSWFCCLAGWLPSVAGALPVGALPVGGVLAFVFVVVVVVVAGF